MTWFKSKEPTREFLIKDVAYHLVQLNTAPNSFFGGLSLAEGQTPDVALAEWHALTMSSMFYALWASLGSGEKIFPILDAFQPAFAKALAPGCREVFLAIVDAREAFYVKQISNVLKSGEPADALRLSGLMLRRITGSYDEQREEIGIGLGADVATATGLWHFIVSDIAATKTFMDSLQLKAPKIFVGPMT
jgi:hypothetical protein